MPGEFISLGFDLDKASLALLKAQRLYEAVRRDSLAFTRSNGEAGGPDLGSSRVPGTKAAPGSEKESPDPGSDKDEKKGTWKKWSNRWDRVQSFVAKSIDSPVGQTVDVLGGIPEVGGMIKAGWSGAKLYNDLGGPALKGILRALLPDALRGLGLPKEMVEKALNTALSGISAPSTQISKLRDWDESFRPTLETMKDVFRLRSMAGGTVNAEKMGKLFSFLMDYNKAETGMRRKMEHMGRERMWEAIGKSVEKSLHE